MNDYENIICAKLPSEKDIVFVAPLGSQSEVAGIPGVINDDGITEAWQLIGEDLDKPDVFEKKSIFSRSAAAVVSGLILGSAVGVYGWEQSPENEALRGRWGVRTFAYGNRALQDVDPRALSVGSKALLVGGVVAGITLAVESASGLVTAATMSRKDGLIGKFNGWITKQAKRLETRDSKGNTKGDTALALAGGSSLLVVKRLAESDEDRTFKQNAKTAVNASAAIAAFSGVLAAVTTVAIDTSDIHGHTSEALWLTDRVSDGKTWWAIYLGGIALNRMDKLNDHVGQKIGAWYYSRKAEYKGNIKNPIIGATS